MNYHDSSTAYALVFARLLAGLSGNAASDVGASLPLGYMGFPIRLSNAMPAGASTSYNGKIMLLFGSLNLSTVFGARADVTMRVLSERFADQDQTGLIATSRIDCVNHSLGTATTAGPLIALKGN